MNEVDVCWDRLAGLMGQRSEEGRRRFAYNDATGAKVTCRPQGNLSIAIGVNLEEGLDDDEMTWLSKHRLLKCAAQLSKFSWYNVASATVNRKSVLLDVAFNAGVANLLHFVHMLSAVAEERWADAAGELLDSEAARKDPVRYQPLAELLKGG